MCVCSHCRTCIIQYSYYIIIISSNSKITTATKNTNCWLSMCLWNFQRVRSFHSPLCVHVIILRNANETLQVCNQTLYYIYLIYYLNQGFIKYSISSLCLAKIILLLCYYKWYRMFARLKLTSQCSLLYQHIKHKKNYGDSRVIFQLFFSIIYRCCCHTFAYSLQMYCMFFFY